MKYWLLLYDVVPDYIERRAPLREEHLRLAREAYGRGDLDLAGAFGGDFDSETPRASGAALVFRGETAAAAESFAKDDPYVKNGLVTRWRVFEWMVVVGSR